MFSKPFFNDLYTFRRLCESVLSDDERPPWGLSLLGCFWDYRSERWFSLHSIYNTSLVNYLGLMYPILTANKPWGIFFCLAQRLSLVCGILHCEVICLPVLLSVHYNDNLRRAVVFYVIGLMTVSELSNLYCIRMCCFGCAGCEFAS